jgi:hypothetical protein
MYLNIELPKNNLIFFGKPTMNNLVFFGRPARNERVFFGKDLPERDILFVMNLSNRNDGHRILETLPSKAWVG